MAKAAAAVKVRKLATAAEEANMTVADYLTLKRYTDQFAENDDDPAVAQNIYDQGSAQNINRPCAAAAIEERKLIIAAGVAITAKEANMTLGNYLTVKRYADQFAGNENLEVAENKNQTCAALTAENERLASAAAAAVAAREANVPLKDHLTLNHPTVDFVMNENQPSVEEQQLLRLISQRGKTVGGAAANNESRNTRQRKSAPERAMKVCDWETSWERQKEKDSVRRTLVEILVERHITYKDYLELRKSQRRLRWLRENVNESEKTRKRKAAASGEIIEGCDPYIVKMAAARQKVMKLLLKVLLKRDMSQEDYSELKENANILVPGAVQTNPNNPNQADPPLVKPGMPFYPDSPPEASERTTDNSTSKL